MKTIGILGAGHIGKTVASHFLKAGYQILVSNSKGPHTLAETVRSLGKGAIAVTAGEAAQAEIVLLALPWSQVPALQDLTDWNHKIVIDATNHFTADFGVEDLGGKASSEVVQSHLPGARIVKAFNTLFFKVLAADPIVGEGHRVLFISGDDQDAKSVVGKLIETIGFAPVDLGTLETGSKFQQAKGALSTLNLIKL
jgi:predicted dinucleotide-binding enzyme